MKIAIIGSRTVENLAEKDYDDILNKVIKFVEQFPLHEFHPLTIVSGGAIGADRMAGLIYDDIAFHMSTYYLPTEFKEFLPNWDLYGKSAGFIRNKQIIDECDFVIAIWDGQSKGTAHSIKLAKEQKKDTFIFYFQQAEQNVNMEDKANGNNTSLQ